MPYGHTIAIHTSRVYEIGCYFHTPLHTYRTPCIDSIAIGILPVWHTYCKNVCMNLNKGYELKPSLDMYYELFVQFVPMYCNTYYQWSRYP